MMGGCAPGVDAWVDLTDTPSSITALQFVRGNAAGTALEFAAIAADTLQTAYDASTGGATPEITLDATRGALTIRDAATPIAANLLEVQDSGGSDLFQVTDGFTTSFQKVNVQVNQAPQIAITATNPRMDFVDTTPTNGDTWVLQVANANMRLRNLSNSDGEFRLEERLDLNRTYDPLTVGNNYNAIDFDPAFSTAGLLQFSPNFFNISPNVTNDVNFNIVVLRGGGSYDIAGGTTFTWSMFRANPVMSTSVASQTMPSPNVFDNQMTYGTEANVANQRSGRFVAFHDRGNISVFDGTAAAQTLMNEYTSFLAAPTSTNEGSGLIDITEVYGLKVEGGGLASGRDSYWGVHIGNAVSSVIENIGIEVSAQGSGGSGFDKEIYLTTNGGIFFRETAGGVGINSPATDDMRIFATADVQIDSANLGLYGVTPVAQSAAYTRNATVVEDRTLLASASATTVNNNNVLAALIADLQALGAIG